MTASEAVGKERGTTALGLPSGLIGRRPQLLVRFLDGLLTTRPASVLDRTADFDSARRSFDSSVGYSKHHVLGVCRNARDFAEIVDQVRFLARTLLDVVATVWKGKVYHVQSQLQRTTVFFETMSKRRKGFPSETKVKRGTRIVHGDKLLEEKLGRNDLCPCGSGKRFKKCCLKSGCF